MASPPFTIIGTPFSTFTRSITLALTYKGIAFNQVRVTPHSDTAYENHPFGFLPTLVIHEIDGQKVDLKLRESQAIARYIDRIAPEPTLNIADGDGHALIAEQMWEFVSFVGAHGELMNLITDAHAHVLDPSLLVRVSDPISCCTCFVHRFPRRGKGRRQAPRRSHRRG